MPAAKPCPAWQGSVVFTSEWHNSACTVFGLVRTRDDVSEFRRLWKPKQHESFSVMTPALYGRGPNIILDQLPPAASCRSAPYGYCGAKHAIAGFQLQVSWRNIARSQATSMRFIF
jgi:hypothetical protein